MTTSLAEGLTKNELAARYPHELRALKLERSARDLGPDAELELGLEDIVVVLS